jgi:hypothetical protein
LLSASTARAYLDDLRAAAAAGGADEGAENAGAGADGGAAAAGDAELAERLRLEALDVRVTVAVPWRVTEIRACEAAPSSAER